MGDRDEKIRIVKDGRSFLVDLVVAAEYGWLKVVLVSWTVVGSFVFAIRNLVCVVSIQLSDWEAIPTVIFCIMSSLVYLVESR